MPDRVVVVQEVKTVQVNGENQEYLVVSAPDGSLEEIPVLREDNADNGQELEGSELPADDELEQ